MMRTDELYMLIGIVLLGLMNVVAMFSPLVSIILGVIGLTFMVIGIILLGEI